MILLDIRGLCSPRYEDCVVRKLFICMRVRVFLCVVGIVVAAMAVPCSLV